MTLKATKEWKMKLPEGKNNEHTNILMKILHIKSRSFLYISFFFFKVMLLLLRGVY